MSRGTRSATPSCPSTASANNPIDDGATAVLATLCAADDVLLLSQCLNRRWTPRARSPTAAKPNLRSAPKQHSPGCKIPVPPRSSPWPQRAPCSGCRPARRVGEIEPQVLAEEPQATRLSVRCSSRCSSVNLSAAPPPPSSPSLAKLRRRCSSAARRCCSCCGCLCCCAPAPCACTPRATGPWLSPPPARRRAPVAACTLRRSPSPDHEAARLLLHHDPAVRLQRPPRRRPCRVPAHPRTGADPTTRRSRQRRPPPYPPAPPGGLTSASDYDAAESRHPARRRRLSAAYAARLPAVGGWIST